jgi:hypothetical protein
MISSSGRYVRLYLDTSWGPVDLIGLFSLSSFVDVAARGTVVTAATIEPSS